MIFEVGELYSCRTGDSQQTFLVLELESSMLSKHIRPGSLANHLFSNEFESEFITVLNLNTNKVGILVRNKHRSHYFGFFYAENKFGCVCLEGMEHITTNTETHQVI